MSGFVLTQEQITTFHRDGFVFIPDLLDREEVELLGQIARADADFLRNANDRLDASGARTRLSLRNELYEDVYSAVVRSESLVNAMECLLGDEVYHYHHKMTMKEPFEGGAWEWHQDYGYWYNNGCLYPDMASCMIAVDPATRENGCLQVLRGSHRMGRFDHGKTGEQTGADPERVEEARKRLELVYCEMEPGTAVIFHCNTLHRSDQNRSANPRWAFICCYNTRHNDPYKKHGHPNYHFLEKWPDSRIKEVGRRQLTELCQTT
ncbi:MAG: phytanoyl-CoA dioxygenase family protein [Chloroherpetonaceae bacterium]|nr:phytanoyl-CoA dioxygenase family protein [Chthonomonadaceae bacterium]MDW8207984.1 phytanoyl-CoA dioxygenase family protein [Chloroherpetonaceae bacterium]